jgi:hypothetical protein
VGANIGLTMADMAVRFPRARLVGIELDADNVFLAKANLAPWRDRCEVVHAAAWTSDTEVFYAPLPGHTAGHRIGGAGPASPVAPSACRHCRSTRCWTGTRKAAGRTT